MDIMTISINFVLFFDGRLIFESTNMKCKLGKFSISEGNEPLKLLLVKDKNRKLVNFPISVGIVP